MVTLTTNISLIDHGCPYDFGAISLGFYASVLISVSSIGCAELNVSGWSLTGSGDFDMLSHSTAVTLAPGESRDISIGYQTMDAGPDEAELHVQSDDPDGTLVVLLSGQGV